MNWKTFFFGIPTIEKEIHKYIIDILSIFLTFLSHEMKFNLLPLYFCFDQTFMCFFFFYKNGKLWRAYFVWCWYELVIECLELWKEFYNKYTIYWNRCSLLDGLHCECVIDYLWMTLKCLFYYIWFDLMFHVFNEIDVNVRNTEIDGYILGIKQDIITIFFFKFNPIPFFFWNRINVHVKVTSK